MRIVNYFYLLLFLLISAHSFGQTTSFTFKLDANELADELKAEAPDFSQKSAHINGPAVCLPMPSGELKEFRMFKTHPMHPELAAKFPEIQTYHGKCYDDGVSAIAMTFSPKGLSAYIITETFQNVYVEPLGGNTYQAFHGVDQEVEHFMCAHAYPSINPKKPTFNSSSPGQGSRMANNALALGDKLRTYRLAMSCTGEYADAHGGTKASVQAQMTANVNAINIVFIRELAAQFQIVADNDKIIYLDGPTDPFLNNGQLCDPSDPPSCPDDLERNNTTCNNEIGAANYDIGHLMQNPTSCPGCGGWAGPGPCNNNKASGMSVDDVPVLIHEIGHQFWMPHTTDTGTDRYDNIAIGNTIMGRNGALEGDNTYFHITSANIAAVEMEMGSHCVPGTNTNNSIPMVDAGTGGMYIPKSTPFKLSGTATDPDPNTTLLYNWQQYNSDQLYDTVNNVILPLEDNPVFRNWFPTADGNVRYIPRMEDLINNNTPSSTVPCESGDCNFLWEGLPTYARNLTFRLVARDFEPTGGAHDWDELSFEVAGNAGPFKINAPNGGETWTAGTNETISWDVANTNIAPVNCANVDIFLSLDGGYTYPVTIATNTPNDGTYIYAVPEGFPAMTQARVKIESTTHENVVFFDISNGDFSITGPCVADAGIIVPATPVTAPAGSSLFDLNPSPEYGQISSSSFSVLEDPNAPEGNYAILDIGQTGCHQGAWNSEYTTFTFQVDKPDTFYFDVNFATSPEAFFAIYDGNYVPNSPCTNFITSYRYLVQGGAVGITNPFFAVLSPGKTYMVHVHPWFSNFPVNGTVHYSASDNGQVFNPGQGSGPPASDYAYTYVAFNTANGQAAAVSAGADFTSLSAGSYEVYGASYKSANPPPAIVDPNSVLNQTREQILASALCIVFSDNHIDLTVEPPACTPPTVTAPTVTQPTCAVPTGSIVVNTTGGNPPFNYSVDNGASWQSSATFSNLNPGSYFIKVQEQNNTSCEASYGSNPVVLNAPTGCCTPPTVNAPTVTQPTCAVPTGSIVVNTSGGNPPFDYSVDDGVSWQASATFSNLNPGSYTLKVREQGNQSCQASYASNPVVLIAPSGCCTPPTVNAPTVTQPTCAVPTGSIVVNTTGGNPPFDYSVDDGGSWQSSATFNNLNPGSYFIKVRQQNNTNCEASYGNNPVMLNAPAGCAGGETLDFDGSDDHIILPANLTASLTTFTFEAWVYWDGSTNWQRIMDFGENTTKYMYLTPQGGGTNKPLFAITTGSSGGEERINSSVAAAVGQWQHYAVVLDGANTGTMYIDGVQVGQNTSMTLNPASLGNLSNNYLGLSQYFFDPYFDGKLDEVRIWDVARTEAEINCQKDYELVGNEAGLIAYYNFNQGTAGGDNTTVTTLDDITSNNNDGTLTNFALTGSGSNWVEPGSPATGTNSSCCPSGSVIYVNDNASGANDGTSWTDAYADLQLALTEAGNCPNITEIWVAGGTYKPTSGTDRNISFQLQNNLAIYGGFAGTESSLSGRPNPLESTFLSGDIGTINDNSDNSYHVISSTNVGSTAVLNGFLVLFGNADGAAPNNTGGGMFNVTNAIPTLNKVVFLLNKAVSGGAVFNNNGCSPIFNSCAFVQNEATANEGGAIYNITSSSPEFINCLFQQNTAGNVGGAVFSTGNCSPILMNCTITENTANSGAGIWNQFSSNTTATNCIFWNNTGGTSIGGSTFNYCLIQESSCPGGSTCDGNTLFNLDPLFVSNADVSLQPCSPAKNRGTNTGAPSTDYNGDPRPEGPAMDLGYLENSTACANCYSTTSADVPKDILDNTTVTSTVYIDEAGTLSDLNITLEGTHSYVGDLAFTLTSPQGTTVTLIQTKCSSAQNFHIILDDEAANPITCPLFDNPPATERPDNPLAAFIGEDPEGSWVLAVTDNAGGDQGSLNSWTLDICGNLSTTACPPTLTVSNPINSETYHAANSLTSDGTVTNGTNATFKAGNDHTLDVNFEVELGATLEVLIEVCVPLQGEEPADDQ